MKQTAIAVSRPCAQCPFRRDVVPFLRLGRVREIVDRARRHGEHFVCHETVDYSKPTQTLDPGRRACAGFMILARRSEIFDGLQLVQLADRLVGLKAWHFRGAESVYASAADMLEAHKHER